MGDYRNMFDHDSKPLLVGDGRGNVIGQIGGLMAETYDEDYFLHGKKSGKSLYENYRWLPDLTVPMAQRIAEHCGMQIGQKVLDFGCARGYLVKALRGLGYDARGVDASRWAIENADEVAAPYCKLVSGRAPQLDDGPVGLDWAAYIGEHDWVVAKDVLEHVPSVCYVVDGLMRVAEQGVFVVVPLSKFDSGKYVVEDYEKDVTHIQRLRLATWAEMFMRPGWRVEASYRVPGIKDNYAQYERGNGFVTARRL